MGSFSARGGVGTSPAQACKTGEEAARSKRAGGRTIIKAVSGILPNGRPALPKPSGETGLLGPRALTPGSSRTA